MDKISESEIVTRKRCAPKVLQFLHQTFAVQRGGGCKKIVAGDIQLSKKIFIQTIYSQNELQPEKTGKGGSNVEDKLEQGSPAKKRAKNTEGSHGFLWIQDCSDVIIKVNNRICYAVPLL